MNEEARELWQFAISMECTVSAHLIAV